MSLTPRDANNQPYTPYDFSAGSEDAELAAIEVARETDEDPGAIPRPTAIVLLVGSGFFGIAFLIHSARHGLIISACLVALALAAYVTYFIRVIRSQGLISWRARQRGLLLAGRCPQCAYDLKKLNAHPGDRVTCPECGATWTLIAAS